MKSVTSKEVRKYIYAILVALGPVAAFYGLATQEEVALWLGVGGTILALPAGTLALANLTPNKTEPGVIDTETIDEDPEVVIIDIDDDETVEPRHAGPTALPTQV